MGMSEGLGRCHECGNPRDVVTVGDLRCNRCQEAVARTYHAIDLNDAPQRLIDVMRRHIRVFPVALHDPQGVNWRDTSTARSVVYDVAAFRACIVSALLAEIGDAPTAERLAAVVVRALENDAVTAP